MSIVGLFPGQGSQVVSMGVELAENFDVAKELFDTADDVLGFSLSRMCKDGPIEELTLTKHAQPAILTVSVAAYNVAGIKIDAAAGHSLGEYSALVAAGCIDFADAVGLVYKRGTYMQEAVEPGLGAMVAVMGPEESEINSAISQVSAGVVEIANLNSPGQTVIAGEKTAVEEFCEKIKESGAKVIPLNVSAPFHCSLMKPAADKLAADLDAIEFKKPNFPVYANVNAKAISSGDEARELLKQQVCSSVRWTESMQNIVRELSPSHLVEFGAGTVLSKLQKRIDKSVTALNVGDCDSLEKTKAAL